jgi:hypothetical protein
VAYHQNVYDLLQLEPGQSPEAARLIAEHEAAHGPLPASLREWYLIPNVVLLQTGPPEWQWANSAGTIWYDFSNQDQPRPLPDVLAAFANVRAMGNSRHICVLIENQSALAWWVELNGSDDPPVWHDNGGSGQLEEWRRVADTFSEFTTNWIGRHYHWQCRIRNRPGLQPLPNRPFANGLWLRTPAEPFTAPVIDYLTEQIDEPQRTPRPGNVTTYTFRPSGGTVRVTADEPGLAGGLSAWWLHAESPERLAELARLIVPFGTLRETLRADTDPGREVLAAIR